MTYDVVIVGGGPAGSVAAWELARTGARVLVVERETVPRYKTCGGGVLRRALEWLPGGLNLDFERECRTIEVNLLAPGQHYVVRRAEPIVCMTMRSELDRALLEHAVRAGAEFRDRCAFRNAEGEDGRLVVTAGGDRLSTRFLLGADGATGVVARRCGFEEHRSGIPALEAELRVRETTLERFRESVRFDFDPPRDGYAWIFPKREHLSVGVLRMRRGRAGLRSLLSAYLERVGVTGVRELEEHGSLIPVRPRRRPARGRVLLLGDAAGLADPLTAEGISPAVHSARLAARAIRDGGGEPDRVRRLYLEALRGEMLPENRAGRMMARLLYGRPALRARVFAALGQQLCEALTDVIAGNRTYRELLTRPRNWLKAARVLGRPTRGGRSIA